MYSSLVLKSERTDKRTLTCMALDDWKLGVKKSLCSLENLQQLNFFWKWMIGGLVLKKSIYSLGKRKNGMILLNWYKKYLWDIGKEEKSVSQLFLEIGDGEISISKRQTWCGFWNFLLWHLCWLMTFCGTS